MESIFPVAGSDYVKHGISVLPGCEGRMANRHTVYTTENQSMKSVASEASRHVSRS
ncbi:hypothetical protein EV681_4466 [Advenella incenata]|uniref:Uncharacterized protein n=1 Tax=Advenella incenata TaxID=267800 RepID=A0A4Q7V7X1_9BURK|nr:hypothetical protein EV681_4466 [Advenella incenata]